MSQIPVRSLRLRSFTTADLDRLSGDRGAVFYDGDLKTLKIYNGSAQTASSVAVIKDGGLLSLGATSGAIYANQTTGQITIGDYLGPNGAPAAPSTVIAVGGATNVFQISTYGPPARVWTFGKNGGMTFPDATVQTTAWTGIADYRNLTNKPEIPEAYSFSVAADDSTQRAISNNELIKFTGAGTVTTASDAEGNITITGAAPSSLVNGIYTLSLGLTGNTTFPTGLTLGAPRGVNTVNFACSVDKEFQIETGTATSGKLWNFGTDGSLTIPGDIKSNNNINIDINLSDSTLRRWSFGEDGILTFPDGTNQTTAFTGIPGPYADDEAAALAGVALGSPYHKTGTNGQVFVRLTSPT